MANCKQSPRDTCARSDTWTPWHLGYEDYNGKSAKPVSINRIAESYDSGRVLNPGRQPETPRGPKKTISYNNLHKSSRDNFLYIDTSQSSNSQMPSRMPTPTNRTSTENFLSGPVPQIISPRYVPSKKLTNLSTLHRTSSFKFDIKQSEQPMPSVMKKHLLSSISTLPGNFLSVEGDKNRTGKKFYDNRTR
jgi:hypothetical protein